MNEQTIFEHNRVILYHFDTYSTALLFARYGNSILAPLPLAETASAIPAPDEIDARHSPGLVLDAVVSKYGFDPAQLGLNEKTQAWMSCNNSPVCIHFIPFNTLDAPKLAIEPGIFKPISDMRGLPMTELNLLRQVFNQIMSGG
jgi:hypothetical protein